MGVVIGVSVTFLTTGSNFLTRTETNAADKALAERSADFIKDRLLYASAIEVVEATTPPAVNKDQEVLFIGNVTEGSIEITNTGRLYYQRHDTASPMAIGSGEYKGNALALSYGAKVRAGKGASAKSASFEIEAKVVRDGKQTQAAKQTFDLPNVDPYGEPSRDVAIASWEKGELGKTFYLLITPPTDGYVQSDLIMHLDAIDNSTKGVGPNHNPDTNIWSDLSGNGNDMQLMVTEGGVRKADPKPSDRVRSRSIYFDGSGDYASMATSSGLLDLSPYDKVTVEVCFKEAVKDQVKMLYEFTENANLPVNTGGFFISTNQNGEDLYPGEIHSCTNNIGHTGTTAHGAKDFKWLNDPSKFCTITMQMSKVADDTGRLSFVDGVPAPFFMPTDREDLVDKATDDTNTIDEGDFAKANFYIGSRAGKESFFKGEIYSVRIYGRKLTDSEIQRNAEADRRRFGD